MVLLLLNEFLSFIRRPNVSLFIDIVILVLLVPHFISYVNARFWLGAFTDVLVFAIIAYAVGVNIANRRK